MREVHSDYPEVNTALIAKRVAEDRLSYIDRNNDRANRELDYYKQKNTAQMEHWFKLYRT